MGTITISRKARIQVLREKAFRNFGLSQIELIEFEMLQELQRLDDLNETQGYNSTPNMVLQIR